MCGRLSFKWSRCQKLPSPAVPQKVLARHNPFKLTQFLQLSNIVFYNILLFDPCLFQLERQQQQIRELKKDHHVETEKIVNDFSQKLNELEVKLSEKTREVELMHSELKLVKEFRRKRSQMQKDLEDVSKSIKHFNYQVNKALC